MRESVNERGVREIGEWDGCGLREMGEKNGEIEREQGENVG